MDGEQLKLPIDFFRTGLELTIDSRPYVVRHSDFRGVHVSAIYPRPSDDLYDKDITLIDHDDPRVKVSWFRWNVRALAAGYLQERYVNGAFMYLDGTGNPAVKSGNSLYLIKDAMRRYLSGQEPALGALGVWSKYTGEPGNEVSKRETIVNIHGGSSVTAIVCGPRNFRELENRWKVGWFESDPNDKYKSIYTYHHGVDRDIEGKKAADKILAEKWILL